MKKINIEKELNKKTKWLTLDYDRPIPFVRFEFFKLTDLVKKATIYKTKHGFHVICELRESMKFIDVLALRSELGDDPKRVQHDLNNPRLGNRMFTQKRKVDETIVI